MGGVIVKNAFLKGVKIKCDHDAEIYIGPRTMMNNCILTAYGKNSCFHIEGGSTNIKNSYINVSHESGEIIISTGFTCEGMDLRANEGKTVTIGKDCMFSHGIYISTTDYHSIISVDGRRVNSAKDIVIGNHVWLGRNVTVLKGSSITDNIVVGSNSLVSGTLGFNNAVYAGTPAGLVRQSIFWKRELI